MKQGEYDLVWQILDVHCMYLEEVGVALDGKCNRLPSYNAYIQAILPAQ
jgi:hypothetical protein